MAILSRKRNGRGVENDCDEGDGREQADKLGQGTSSSRDTIHLAYRTWHISIPIFPRKPRQKNCAYKYSKYQFNHPFCSNAEIWVMVHFHSNRLHPNFTSPQRFGNSALKIIQEWPSTILGHTPTVKGYSQGSLEDIDRDWKFSSASRSSQSAMKVNVPLPFFSFGPWVLPKETMTLTNVGRQKLSCSWPVTMYDSLFFCIWISQICMTWAAGVVVVLGIPPKSQWLFRDNAQNHEGSSTGKTRNSAIPSAVWIRVRVVSEDRKPSKFILKRFLAESFC